MTKTKEMGFNRIFAGIGVAAALTFGVMDASAQSNGATTRPVRKTKKELLSYVSKKYANLANPGMNKHVRISRVFHRSNIWADIGTCRMGRRYSV